MTTFMERQRAFKLVAAGGAALALQGCIAAAFPIAASGLLASGARTSGTDEAETAIGAPAQTASLAPEPKTAADAVGGLTTVPEPEIGAPALANVAETGDTSTAAITSVEPETAPQVSSSVPDNSPSGLTPIATAVAPPVSAAAPIAAAVPPPSSPPPSPVSPSAPQPTAAPISTVSPAPVTLFDPLFGYASAPEFVGGQDRTSAMLLDATSLEADRVKCTNATPTVLIDLDPKEGELFPIDAGTASPALAERLTQLRAQGVSIAWISNSSADRESIIRVALFRSGLDQLGADRLLLVRAPDQRKQLLREQLAETSCLVAIAGDERADFHELFDYLLNPSDAVALEPMIGEGWFIIPTPLLAEGTR